MNFLQMSRSGAVMILVIVVIRALAINKLPKKTFLVLWGVAAARLLIPFSFPSAFSVYSLLEQFAPAAEAVRDMNAPPFTPTLPAHNVMPIPGTAATDTAAATVDLWAVVWLVGGLACAMFFAVAYLKCRSEFKASLPVDSEYAKHWLGEHHICRAIEIRQSGRISAPLTYGVLRPVILMPKTADWDDSDTLKYVLAHEYVHIRRFDAVTKLALTVALCVHWFNPAVWIMYVLANRDIELSCDEAVIRQFGERTKSAYAMTLIRMEETRSGLTPLCNNFSKNAIEERITAIMKIKKTSLFTLFAAAILVVSITVAFATSGRDMGHISEEKAFDLLEKSITYKQGALSFTVPDADTPSDPWYINVAGRLEYPDGFSSSIHYFNTTEWARGETYSEWIGESSLYFTELFLDMELGEYQRSIDLIPYVQGAPAFPGTRGTVTQEATMTSYTDPRDGKTYYSFDGGKTFVPLTDEEFAARFPTPKVEWWTYDEYKEWLENEKVQLQNMIGERAWTSGRGDFVWTQEIVDEAIAMYEEILENIGRGMLYSKTIDGEADTSFMMGMNPADIDIKTELYISDATISVPSSGMTASLDEATKQTYYQEYIKIAAEVAKETELDISVVPMNEFQEEDWRTPEQFRNIITEVANWNLTCTELVEHNV